MVKFVNKSLLNIFPYDTIRRGTRLIQANRVTGKIPLVTAGAEKQGVSAYIQKNTELFKSNSITIDMFGNVFYRNYNFFADDNIIVLHSDDISQEAMLYLASVLNKTLSVGFSYGKQFRMQSLKFVQIQVPVTPTGELDTAYMASYVQKIEASYVQKIEAYLAVLGYKSLADCQLNQHDLDVLHIKPKMEKIKVNSLFSISKLKGLNKNDLNINSKGKYPYITRTAQNNGVESYTDFVDNDHLQPAGTFSLGLMQMSLFYQSKPWYNGQFVRKITPTKNYNSKELIFLQTHLQKLTNLFDPQAIRKVDDVFNKASFTLPVTSLGTPDWQFMEDYITAIEKLKILKIKQFLDTKINAYQNTIK